MDVTKLMKKSRGRGSSRGGGGGGRGGRGRGGGRGRISIFSTKAVPVVNLDDDDEVCNMALEQAELENNSIAKSFQELNAANELEGFDPMTGNIWIYPTNRPVRDYQYEIVKTALFNNTLVSLPTGLGKTFISAVVMYNFQRWYPTGIIVFMAPTRPLVTQQLDACHNTVGISPAKTVELTGQIAPKRREQLWKTKTVFFLTPQVMLSDLERNFFPPEKVRCIVVDEAHKALGNHAYVQVISKISEKNRLFRVLALSATPGSDMTAVKQVFKNLLISRVELRSENSIDILPYIHDKKVEQVVVKLDDYLKSVHDQLLEVFQTYSGKLMKANALSGRDGTSFAKYTLLKARDAFRKDMAHKLPNYQKGYIEVDFSICITLAHSMEILLSHGLRSFYMFLQGVLTKEKGIPAVTAELKKSTSLQSVLDDIQKKLNISLENSTFDFDLNISNASSIFSTVGSPKVNLPNRSFIQEDVDFTLSHPKLKILKDIVHKHFLEYQMKNATTRVMIFSQFRDSVQEIGNMLNSLRPMVKPMVFIGQANTSSVGKGLKQKDQVQVVQQFRDGGFNVLVSTSVGEEGLDIGEVDLIICFDASKSPTRLIQRMGRTGRQREGRTVFLLTHGKEERSYLNSFSLHSSISKSITDPNKLQPFLYKQSPRMVPVGIEPTCYKMSIILSTEQSSQPEPMQVDIEDDDESRKEIPQKNTKKKQTNVGKKKKNETAGPGTSSKKLNSDKGTSHNIAKLFERMNQGSVESTPKQQSSDIIIIESPPPPPLREDPPNMVGYDDGYGMEDGLLMFAADSVKMFDNMTVYPKIFDVDGQDRLEWKPCTTFVKPCLPQSSDVTNSSGLPKFDFLVIDEKELAEVEFGVKSRESFSYLKDSFCDCGNTMEPHEAERDRTNYNNPLNSFVLEEPFIEEDFEEDLPLEFLDDFMDPIPQSMVRKTPVCSSPQWNKVLDKTPEVSSDEDMKSEFSASPEVCTNRFFAQLKEIKAAKTTAATSTLPTRSNDEDSWQPSVDISELETETTTDLNISKRKFIFKKKFTFKKKSNFENTLQQEESLNMSPSPPLSPILNLPSVTNDLFKVTSPSFANPCSSSSKHFSPTFTAKVASPGPLTPPQPSWQNLSDDSPEVVFTKDKTLSSYSWHNATGNKRIFDDHEQTSVVTPLSRSGSNSRRLRISDSVSVSRSVTRSPVTPTPLRYSYSCMSPTNSRRSTTHSCSPLSRATTLSPRTEGTYPFVVERRENLVKQKRRRANNANPFIEAEADVTDDDSDATTYGDENEFEFDGLDDVDDSFVTYDDPDIGVTDSQRVMYLESVKDAIPARFGRIEKPLSPKNYGNDMDTTGEHYEDDSFCQEDEVVEYMDVGVFTQAMNQAKIDLAKPSNSGRLTRRGKREAMNFKKPDSYQPKQRRRIVTFDDSSDED